MAWGLFIKFILPYIREILLGKDEDGNPTMVSRLTIVFFIGLCCYLFYSFYNFIDEDYTEIHDKIVILEKEHDEDESLLKDRENLIAELNISLRTLAAEVALQRAHVRELRYSLAECNALSKLPPPPPNNMVVLPPQEDVTRPSEFREELKEEIKTELQNNIKRQDTIDEVDKILQEVNNP